MTESVVSLAIATVPDTAAARRLHDFGDLDDADVVRALGQLRFQADGHDTLPPHLCRVSAVAMAVADGDGFRLEMPEGGEEDLLKALASRAGEGARIVSWDASGVSVAALRYRCLLHGVTAPGLWPGTNGTGYLDLASTLSGASAVPVTLGDAARLLGLPAPMTSGDGACATAAVTTHLLHLRYRQLRGDLDAGARAAAESRVREALAARGEPCWEPFLGEWRAA
ncbi:propable PolB [Salinisphaera sp. PC39]|uniref:hypothetical protein n=1 Tax=Salinisphaera sp. PC39 TaxID=1304156 RepID=UPI0033417ED4